MSSRFRPERHRMNAKATRNGMALLVVLVLIVMLSLSAYSFTLLMQNQYQLSRVHEDRVQAKLAAQSGVELVAALVSQTVSSRKELGDLTDNPSLFQDVQVEGRSSSQADQQIAGWSFSVLSANNSGDRSQMSQIGRGGAEGSDSKGYSFGLQNESAKIHLPTLAEWDRLQPGHARRVLESLPGASKQVVDLWLQRLAAADYRPLANPLVQNLWSGNDLNCNYRIDPLEVAYQSMSSRVGNSNMSDGANRVSENGVDRSGSFSSQTTSPDGPRSGSEAQLYGWQQYLTWFSGERNETVSGQPRIFLNSMNLQELHRSLTERWPEEWANFVIAYRQFGPSARSTSRSRNSTAASPAQAESQLTAYQPDFSVVPSFTIGTPLELIGVTVQIPKESGSASGNSSNRQLNSPLRDEISSASDYLRKLLDDVTTDPRGSRTGRVDVNHANDWVLMAVPGMDKELAEHIVQHRQSERQNSGMRGPASEGPASEGPASDTTIAWLFEQGLVDLPRLTQLEPYLTARSDVYSCQVVGYKDDQHAVYRATVTIDARGREPVIRDFRTWHDWDRGFNVYLLRSADERQLR